MDIGYQLIGIKKGILVLNAPKNSPAQKAGIRGTTRISSSSNSNSNFILGDIIIGIDDDIIENESDLFTSVDKHKVGDTISIKIVRTSETSFTNSVMSNGDNDWYSDSNNQIFTFKVKLSSPEELNY